MTMITIDCWLDQFAHEPDAIARGPLFVDFKAFPERRSRPRLTQGDSDRQLCTHISPRSGQTGVSQQSYVDFIEPTCPDAPLPK